MAAGHGPVARANIPVAVGVHRAVTPTSPIKGADSTMSSPTSRHRLRSLAVSLVVALAALPSTTGRAQSPDLTAQLDALVAPNFKADAPGAAVIVVRNGTVVLRKGYGLANLELQTPMRPEMVFEIGSVTKQFTSTAIMMLVERGK